MKLDQTEVEALSSAQIWMSKVELMGLADVGCERKREKSQR